MKKRIIVFVLILAMVLSMTACSSIFGSVLNKGNKGHKDNELSQMMDAFNDLKDTFEQMEDSPAVDVTIPPIEIPPIDIPEVEVPAVDWFPAESTDYDLEDYIYGTWQRETMYLSHYGCDADMYTTFLKNGRAEQVLVRTDNGDVLNESAGDWTFEGDDVVLVKDGETGKIRFSYYEDTHKLKNGDKYYTKISD